MNEELEGLELTDEERAAFEADRAGKVEEPAPAPEPDKAAPAPEAEKPKVEAETPKQDTVSHQALHEERMRRKELARERDEYKEKYIRMEERLKALESKPAPEPSIDPNDDPVGYSHQQLLKQQRELEEARKRFEGDTTSIKQEVEMMRVRQIVDTQEREFESKTPDYRQALDHFVAVRTSQLEELGVEVGEAKGLVYGELAQISNRALEISKNPAEAVYRMSQKMGFKSAPPKEAAPEQKLDALKRGAQAASSLANSPGKGGAAELTAEMIAEMSPEDFAKLSEEDFRRAMGG